MGAVADTLFTALMSWVRALVSDLWTIASPERTSILEFLGKHWIALTLMLLAVGLALDWLIWLVRWQPYRLWAQRIRRALRLGPPPEEEDDAPQTGRAHAARMPERREAGRPAAGDWLPLAPSEPDEEEARLALERAGQVPDASLRAYPGMRYDAQRVGVYEAPPEGSALSSVHSEGPGAAETARRQAEIAAWNRQLEDEARAQAEQARIAREAEQARLAQEAEQARLVRVAQEQERARREAQQAQAQRRYEAEMAEYERQMEQYRRDLAEYERQKAAYDAAQAAQAAPTASAAPAAQEAEHARRAPQSAPPSEPGQAQAPARHDGFMNRVARAVRNIEPEQTDVSAIPSLPPRVDKFDAYAPPVRPPRGRRNRK